MAPKTQMLFTIMAILLGSRVAAAPTTVESLSSPNAEIKARCVEDGGYATFYNDNECTQNPGIAVSMDNNGCLTNEVDRNSIYIQPDCGNGPISMQWYSDTQCGSPAECEEVPNGWGLETGNSCWNLHGNALAGSFKFFYGSSSC